MTCLLVGVGVTTAVATHGWSAFLKVFNITENIPLLSLSSLLPPPLTTAAAVVVYKS